MIRNEHKITAFTDGVMDVYNLKNITVSPNRPVMVRDTVVERLRYRERTIGIARHAAAAQEQTRIDLLLRAPRRDTVNTQHVVMIGEAQYRILRIQCPEDAMPPVMDLSLERLMPGYDAG